MEERAVAIPCGDITLEGVAHVPQGRPLGAVVVCHPHPLYGGDMDNHVVVATCQALAGAGMVALRFNFRGTGRSGGHHQQGAGEQEDVLAAADVAQRLTEGAPLGLAGYSFGAAVAAAAAPRLQGLKALALISPPTGMVDVASLVALGLPVLIMVGERDPFAPPRALDMWARALGERCELVVVPGADHFWALGFAPVAARLAAFMRRCLTGAARP